VQAVAHHWHFRGYERVNREIIKPLAAWDIHRRNTIVLPAGAVVSACRILRNHTAGDEPYVMEFDSNGRRYACPLFTFQPRTQAVAAVVEIEPAEQALEV
jgi:hypothetical protein